jgi:predicted small lipoprotein YifL
MKKKLLFSGILVCLLIFSFGLMGCPAEGPVPLPANLKNTSWTAGTNDNIHFLEDKIYFDDADDTHSVSSATENGKIVVNPSTKDTSGYGGTLTLFDSYSISGDTLTAVPGSGFVGLSTTYTKIP